ncbi:Cytochrome c oxidase assembly protein [Dirofilaria immitis]
MTYFVSSVDHCMQQELRFSMHISDLLSIFFRMDCNERSSSSKHFMNRASSWKFICKGLPFLTVGGATLLLAYKIQQIKFEFGPSSYTFADAEEVGQFLNTKGIGYQQKNIEAVYQELVEKEDKSWENIRGPRDSEDNKEFLLLKKRRQEERETAKKKLKE